MNRLARQVRLSRDGRSTGQALQRTAVLALLVLVAGCSAMVPDPRWLLPDALAPRLSDRTAIRALVRGDALFVCAAREGARGELAWRLTELNGVLEDEKGQWLGTLRELARLEWADGSTVVGKPVATTPPLRAGAPDWTRFQVVDAPAAGALAGIATMILSHTEGGHPPDLRCGRQHVSLTMKFPFSGRLQLFRP